MGRTSWHSEVLAALPEQAVYSEWGRCRRSAESAVELVELVGLAESAVALEVVDWVELVDLAELEVAAPAAWGEAVGWVAVAPALVLAAGVAFPCLD